MQQIPANPNKSPIKAQATRKSNNSNITVIVGVNATPNRVLLKTWQVFFFPPSVNDITRIHDFVLSLLFRFPDAGSSTSLASSRHTDRRFPSSFALLLPKRSVFLDPKTCNLLTFFLAIFGVVFLNLEVLKRFMFPSQIDFRAFRVSVELCSTVLPLQLTALGFAARCSFALGNRVTQLGGNYIVPTPYFLTCNPG